MKTSKKILGIVLALVMLANVVAVVSFAGFPDDASVKLLISADKASYSAGDTVTLTVSEQVTAEVGKMTIGGTYEIAYNSAGLEPIAAANNGDTLESIGFTIPDATLKAGYDSTLSQLIPTMEIDAAQASANSWDKALALSVAEAGVADRATIAVDCTEPVALFTFQMKIPAGAADGTYKIGFSQAGYEQYNAYSNDLVNTGLYGNVGSDMGLSTANIYDFGTCDIVVGAGGTTPPPAEPTITVENIATQVKWQDKDAGTMLVAFRGNIKGYTPEVTEGELTSLKEIGVYFSTTDSSPTAEEGATVVPAWTIYNFTTGGYFYRAVVGNYDYQNTTTLYANAYIKLADDTIITATNGVTSTTGAAEYTRATAAGMEAK